MHVALDIVLDALAEELRGEPAKKKRRVVSAPTPELPKDVTPAEVEAAERRWQGNGFTKKH
jgi:hypothetical protein